MGFKKFVKEKYQEAKLERRKEAMANKLIREKLNWEPKMKLIDGMKITYKWIKDEVKKNQVFKVKTIKF